MNLRLKNSEVTTAATFVKANFLQDRAEIETTFPEFNESYQADYLAQIEVVKKLNSKYAKTQQQTAATQKLYAFGRTISTTLNQLIFMFKGTTLSSKPISAVKVKLKSLDFEAAFEDLKTIAQLITNNLDILAPKGISVAHANKINEQAEELLRLNVLQNKIIDEGIILTEINRKEYDKLRKMIIHIMGAGKIAFAEEKRKDFYIMKKLIARLRSPNSGNTKETKESEDTAIIVSIDSDNHNNPEQNLEEN